MKENITIVAAEAGMAKYPPRLNIVRLIIIRQATKLRLSSCLTIQPNRSIINSLCSSERIAVLRINNWTKSRPSPASN